MSKNASTYFAPICVSDADQALSLLNNTCDERDVTSVYDAFRTCNPEFLADAVFPAHELKSVRLSDQSADAPHSFCIHDDAWAPSPLQRYAVSILGLLLEFDPDYETSLLPPLRPWDMRQISALAGIAWPLVLGRRIVLPKSLEASAKHWFLARILRVMAFT